MKRKKQGFEIPVDAWLRGELEPMFRDLALSAHSPAAGLIDRDRATALFEEHKSGRGRHGQVLWSLLVLTRWAERFLAPQPVAP